MPKKITPKSLADEPGLFVTATPIGNLGDMTARAIAVLKGAQVIACEDTRVTSKLLKAYGIDTPMLSYHDHSPARVRAGILKRLEAGETVALVSDAGTPLISDPGYKLVREAAAAGIPVRPLPGASAALAALVVSGLPSDRFMFAGFLPSKRAAREKQLRELAGINASLIFYESGRRIGAALAAMTETFGPTREAAISRELTKLHEETLRGTLFDLAARYGPGGEKVETRGEFVIVVGPPEGVGDTDKEEVDRLLAEALKRLSVREAAHAVAYISGAKRRAVYQRALEISDDQGGNRKSGKPQKT